jgi:Antibiotic biosynthesis monooxygenase
LPPALIHRPSPRSPLRASLDRDDESPTYLNYAIWESTAAFRAAFTHPEFQAKLSGYPSSAVASPHLFQKVAIKGICAA